MKRIYLPASVIITSYGSVLLLIAFFFLMRDNSLHKLQSALPMSFIFRFCMFWFISVVLAIVIFMVNLNINNLTSSNVEKLNAKRVGFIAFSFAALGAILAVAAFYFLQF